MNICNAKKSFVSKAIAKFGNDMPQLFVVTLIIPGTPLVATVQYFSRTKSAGAGNLTEAEKLWERFLNSDDEFRKSRFKLPQVAIQTDTDDCRRPLGHPEGRGLQAVHHWQGYPDHILSDALVPRSPRGHLIRHDREAHYVNVSLAVDKFRRQYGLRRGRSDRRAARSSPGLRAVRPHGPVARQRAIRM